MSKIKHFFLKKKEEVAFKLKLGASLGQGHTLAAQNSETSSSCRKTETEYIPHDRKELSNEVKAAAAAAVARVEKMSSKEVNTSMCAIKAKAKKEVEVEQKVHEKMLPSKTVSETANANSICESVLFRCPMVDEEVLPKNDWENKIQHFLYQQLESEKALTSCLIIHNCNNKEEAKNCVRTLSKYLENVIQFPGEEKYCKIRMANRIFCENVRYIEGACDFLFAAGFREVVLDNEKYLIWSEESVDKDYKLTELLEALNNSEPFQLELDRNVKVILPSQAKSPVLPPDFYRISPEEIRREQLFRAEALERAQTLKTKAMRECEEQKALKIYRYSLVRVKFPDGLLIQGTFGVYEKLTDVFEFVQSCVQKEDLKFNLVSSSGGKFTNEDMNKTLYELRLVPNIILLFTVHNETYDGKDNNYIKEDLLLLTETI